MKLLILSVLAYSILSSNPITTKLVYIDGTVWNSSFQQIDLSYQLVSGETQTTSAPIKNNSFHFEVPADIEHPVILRANGSTVDLYLDKDTTQVLIQNDMVESAVINSSKTAKELAVLNQEKQFISIDRERISRHPSLLNLAKEINKLTFEEIKIELAFIENNPNSFVSLERLKFRATKQPEWPSIDSIFTLFNRLSKLVKYSPEGQKTKELFNRIKASAVGQPVPNFTATTIAGEVISADNWRNSKVYLIDFWADWCAPCKQEFPELKKLHELYKAKGFELLSICIDTNSTLVKENLTRMGIEDWKNVQLEQISPYPYYPALPTKFLIDKNGVIVGRWRGSSQAFIQEIEALILHHCP